MLAGAKPFFVANPLRAKIAPKVLFGSSKESPVPTFVVVWDAIIIGHSIAAYKSYPAACSEPLEGVVAIELSRLNLMFSI